MQFLRSGAAGGISSFGSGKVAKIFSFSSHVNVCAIAISALGYTSKAACVGAFTRTIDGVLRARCQPQISPSVVGGILVYVIDLFWWPFAGHHQPNDSMRQVKAPPASNLDCQQSSWSLSSCWFTDPPWTRRLFPRQNASFGVVIEQAADVLRSKVVAGAFVSHHGSLANV